MTIYLLTFAQGKIYEKSQEMLDKTFKKANIDYHIKWNLDKLKETNFYLENKKMIDNNHIYGFGFWAWKPYIILDLLKKIKDDDYIIYMDASRYEIDGFKNSILDTLSFMKKKNIDIMFGFETKDKNYQRIKPYCLEYFKLNNNKEFLNSFNTFTSPLILKKNIFNYNFINEWLFFCKNEKLVSHEDLSNLNGYYHIYDQAILNCLIYKYKIKTFQPFTNNETEFRKFSYYFDFFSNSLID